MRAGDHKVARAYMLYRESARSERRAERGSKAARPAAPRVATAGGALVPLDVARLERVVARLARDLTDVAPSRCSSETLRTSIDGIARTELATALIMARAR